MSFPRRHRIVLDVSFDRPVAPKRAMYLLTEAMRDIHRLGRDRTRPSEPEAKLIRSELKSFARVIAHEERQLSFEEALRAIIREELATIRRGEQS